MLISETVTFSYPLITLLKETLLTDHSVFGQNITINIFVYATQMADIYIHMHIYTYIVKMKEEEEEFVPCLIQTHPYYTVNIKKNRMGMKIRASYINFLKLIIF